MQLLLLLLRRLLRPLRLPLPAAATKKKRESLASPPSPSTLVRSSLKQQRQPRPRRARSWPPARAAVTDQCTVLELNQQRKNEGPARWYKKTRGLILKKNETVQEEEMILKKQSTLLSLLANSRAAKPVGRRPLRRVRHPSRVHLGQHRRGQVQHQLLPLAGRERQRRGSELSGVDAWF